MWKRDKLEIKTLTAALAREFADMTPMPNDRPIRESRIKTYLAEIAEGHWRICSWARAFCAETNITYRVNGKHTSLMFSQMDRIPDGAKVIVESYVCDTLQDVASLYATFDSAAPTRNHTDINRMYAGTVPEIAGLPYRTLNACASGLALHLGGGDPASSSKLSTDARASLLVAEAQFVAWVGRLITDTHRLHHLNRAGVIAAAFATWRKSQRGATEFWEAVRDETGTTPNAPDRVLAKYLAVTKVHGGFGANAPRSLQTTARELMVRSIYCWNAYRRGEEMKVLRYASTSKIPTVL